MADLSALDAKYFVAEDTYNCPYCNRRHITFSFQGTICFDWSDAKQVACMFIECKGCKKVSMHLTYSVDLWEHKYGEWRFNSQMYDEGKIDEYFFYHQPTSFFTLDSRIPKKIRELLSEAANSRRSGFLVGASACLRKAIYELLLHEGVAKEEPDGRGIVRERHYTDRVKDLKGKRSQMDPTFVDILAGTLTATSDSLHEDSWNGWTSVEFDGIYDSALAVLHEMYVIPAQRKERATVVSDLVSRMKGAKTKPAPAAAAAPAPAKDAG